MNSDRLEALQTMVVQSPDNKLLRYGLAMEYKNRADYDRATEEFRALLAFDPEYAAAYYHGGQSLEKSGLLEQARKMYETGIEITSRTGDAHTRSELQAALDIL